MYHNVYFLPLGWKLVVAGLRSKGMIPPKCGDVEALNTFFSWYCVNQGNGSVPLCPDADVGEKEETADSAALRCLAVGHGDVAFVDKSSLDVLGMLEACTHDKCTWYAE
jgi:hypothetical protein